MDKVKAFDSLVGQWMEMEVLQMRCDPGFVPVRIITEGDFFGQTGQVDSRRIEKVVGVQVVEHIHRFDLSGVKELAFSIIRFWRETAPAKPQKRIAQKPLIDPDSLFPKRVGRMDRFEYQRPGSGNGRVVFNGPVTFNGNVTINNF